MGIVVLMDESHHFFLRVMVKGMTICPNAEHHLKPALEEIFFFNEKTLVRYSSTLHRALQSQMFIFIETWVKY